MVCVGPGRKSRLLVFSMEGSIHKPYYSIPGRTFPGHPYFSMQLGNGQLALFNLLKAYSLMDQDVGYCQGLSFVAGILLMHVSSVSDSMYFTSPY